MTQDLHPAALRAKSWPFVEARALYEHITKKGKRPGDMVTFETGFGPSGLPHIGTFGEVVRTAMVMRAFDKLTRYTYELRLLIVSDDYDALRKVPDGADFILNDSLDLPLSSVPDPLGRERSFAMANNRKLIEFVNSLRIPYSFVSATDQYRSGNYDATLRKVWDNHQAILDIMLPTLGAERRATYCAFMPIGAHTGKVISEGATLAPLGSVINEREIEYRDNGLLCKTSVFGGLTKLQWKVDWAARWVTFDVDYEMSGKDLIDSVKASNQICRAIGGMPPLNMTYELFVDAEGKKISKSKGNGIAMEEWFRYGTREALALFMFQNPRATKTLALDVIPRVSDELLKGLQAYHSYTEDVEVKELDNPTWHIYQGNPPEYRSEVTYQLLINLAQASRTSDAEVLLRYANHYKAEVPEATPEVISIIQGMAHGAIRYVQNVMPAQELRAPTTREARAFENLALRLTGMQDGLDAEAYQFEVYEVGKEYEFEPLRTWFQAIYEVLFGSSQGPRFGTFIEAYGRQPTIELLEEAAGRVSQT